MSCKQSDTDVMFLFSKMELEIIAKILIKGDVTVMLMRSARRLLSSTINR